MELNEGTGLILSLCLSLLSAISVASFQLAKGRIEISFLKKFLITLGYSFLISLALIFLAYLFSSNIATAYAIPVAIILSLSILPFNMLIILLVQLTKSQATAIWLALSLLTPNLYGAFIFTQAKSINEWLISSWPKIPIIFEIMSASASALILSSISNNPEDQNVMNHYIISWPLQFCIWGIIVFSLKFLIGRLNRRTS
jgi:hypothetical protein